MNRLKKGRRKNWIGKMNRWGRGRTIKKEEKSFNRVVFGRNFMVFGDF